MPNSASGSNTSYRAANSASAGVGGAGVAKFAKACGCLDRVSVDVGQIVQRDDVAVIVLWAIGQAGG